MEIPTMGEQIADLKQQLAAAQARIAELRETLNYAAGCLHTDGNDPINAVLSRTDNLSALEAAKREHLDMQVAAAQELVKIAKAQTKREALLEATDYFERNSAGSEWAVAAMRRMVGEVKP